MIASTITAAAVESSRRSAYSCFIGSSSRRRHTHHHRPLSLSLSSSSHFAAKANAPSSWRHIVHIRGYISPLSSLQFAPIPRHDNRRQSSFPLYTNPPLREEASLSSSSTSSSTSNAQTTTPTPNDIEEPFTWQQLIHLFRLPRQTDNNIYNDNYIPSSHPNLALFRRSTAVQTTYLKHQRYLKECWRSPYDYLCVQKFGAEFGFERVMVKKNDGGGGVGNDGSAFTEDESAQNNNNNLSSSKGTICKQELLTTPTKGYRYQSCPSLTQASARTIQHKTKYLRLIPNDYPYDLHDGIEHWCLWKIGGAFEGEGILKFELDWALRELHSFGVEDVVNGSSRIIVDCNDNENNEAAESSNGDVVQCNEDHPILDTFYWTNPPHLQSMPEIHHAHILVLRWEEEDRSATTTTNRSPPC
eukprot:g1815.t1 g1815   contig11:119289-120533(-)